MSGTTEYAWAMVFATLAGVPVPWIAAGAATVFAAALLVRVVLQRRSPGRHAARTAEALTVDTDAPPSSEAVDTMTSPRAESDEPAPAHIPADRVPPEDASLLWPDAHLLAEPPADYTPLEIPALWEPDPSAPIWAQEPQDFDPAQDAPPWHPPANAAGEPVAPQQPHLPPQHPFAGPPAGYVISVPEIGSTTGNSPTGNIPTGRRPQGPVAPRSFRDLRTGPLEGREFATMREFAVAAVLEAGYAEVDVARLFRFAPWQLRTWVEEARGPAR